MVRTVRFMQSVNGEDLYRCKENKKVYIRQQCNEKYVRWLTSSKWTGGYEADCPMKEGIKIRVVDNYDNVLFEETLITVDGIWETCAEKKGPFHYDAIRSMAKRFFEEYDLIEYNEWKEWLGADAEAYNYKSYSENWLFCEAEHENREIIVRSVVLGERVAICSQKMKHTICGKEWTEYCIWNPQTVSNEALIGFKFER